MKRSTAVRARALEAMTIPSWPMLMPAEAAACQVCGSYAGDEGGRSEADRGDVPADVAYVSGGRGSVRIERAERQNDVGLVEVERASRGQRLLEVGGEFDLGEASIL